VFGRVASDPTVSRTIDALAGDAALALKAIDAARAAARAAVWRLAGDQAPDHDVSADAPLIIDTDATLVTAHSEMEQAAPMFKRGFGFHPLWAFADHGGEGTGEPLTCLLCKGNAGSNTAADHVAVVKAALAQLPGHRRGDSAWPEGPDPWRWGRGHARVPELAVLATTVVLGWVHPARQRRPDAADDAQTQGLDPGLRRRRQVREGAWIVEVTDLLDLSSWPAGIRVIVRKERPHPGASFD
jgi:hypothetical protein